MAKRFEFRLQTLLRVRELREREAKRNLATKRAEIAQLDHLNKQTTEEIFRQQETLLSGQREGQIDPTTLQRGRAWIAHLRHTVMTRQVQRQELVGKLEHLKAAWREARTQTRIIEKLRQRRWKEYTRDRDRREQAELDELAQQLHRQQPVL